MSPASLIDWIKDPKLLDAESLVQLRKIVSEYPCFAQARILFLKNLKIMNDLRFSGELNLTAISVSDRKLLYEFIEDRSKKEILVVKDKIEVTEKPFSIIEHFLGNTEDKITDESVSEVVSPEIIEESKIVKVPEQTEGKTKINTVYSDTISGEVSDVFTFDYFSYISIYPGAEQKRAVNTTDVQQNHNDEDNKLQGHELIDAFIEKQATGLQINKESEKIHDESIPALETTEDALSESTFTETLARIYIKQKRYDRALEIIRSLNLKYPEKNIYFADQIKFLEKLIANKKK
jgi:hypothetical protein